VAVERACLVCGGVFEPAAIRGLLRCATCGFITADVSLTRQELERLYGDAYFRGREYRDYVAERPLFVKQFEQRLKTLLRFVPVARRTRLFEIGAAYGFFLDLSRRHFQQVAGIDLSREAAAYAREVVGVPVASGDFLEYPLEGTVDVVCMWDTIEHLADPAAYIERIAAHMQPGGVVALTTGDIRSWVARWRGDKWRQIHPPSHLHYFSKDTLRMLLAKYGFDVCYASYAGCYRSADTVAYLVLSLKHKMPGPYGKLRAAGLLSWSFYSNLYDIIYVIAKKR
jgi:SAM-dependent methyltransferase